MPAFPSDSRLTGLLLTAGLVTFLVGAGPWKPKAYQAPLPEALPVMAADHRRMRWIYSWMVLGVVTSTTGFAALRDLLVRAGAGVLATVALCLFAIGGMLWVVSLLFFLTVGEHAAADTVASLISGVSTTW